MAFRQGEHLLKIIILNKTTVAKGTELKRVSHVLRTIVTDRQYSRAWLRTHFNRRERRQVVFDSHIHFELLRGFFNHQIFISIFGGIPRDGWCVALQQFRRYSQRVSRRCPRYRRIPQVHQKRAFVHDASTSRRRGVERASGGGRVVGR
jgi:hypothetical protein